MTIFICALPIGCLEDITYRVKSCLETVSVIACEDTRVTKKLLVDLKIWKQQRLLRMDQFQEKRNMSILDKYIASGDLAYVTDAGSPGISDPGAGLVRYCRDQCIQVEVLPGPSALAAFISGCGVTLSEVFFGSFFPRKKGEIISALESCISNQYMGVWFESPKRILKSMVVISEYCPNLQVVLAKELTKTFETWFDGTAAELVENLSHIDCRGEWMMMLNGLSIAPSQDLKMVAMALNQMGISSQQIKPLAKLFDLPANALYDHFQEL